MRSLAVLVVAVGLVTGLAACRYPSTLGDLRADLLMGDAGVSSNTLAAKAQRSTRTCLKNAREVRSPSIMVRFLDMYTH